MIQNISEFSGFDSYILDREIIINSSSLNREDIVAATHSFEERARNFSIAFAFFEKAEGSIEIPLISVGGKKGDVHIVTPLEIQNYGFPNGEKTTLKPQAVQGLELNDESRQLYLELLKTESIGLNELAETVGSIVNSSMQYDLEKALNLRNWTEKQREFLTTAGEKYLQTGREVSMGICSDAGQQIRKILTSLGLEQQFGIVSVAATKIVTHDTTVIFNTITGEWNAINSKSPAKQYNLVQIGNFEELGWPYWKH